MKRRLASILVADVAGYSSLMEADEEGTAASMAACRSIADAAIAKADGRLFKTMGDALLVEFASPLNSVRCAAGIRNALVLAEQGQDPPLTMRFGLHLADVIVDGDDLIGDGVNLAARIQQAAEPGAIDLSGSLFEQIRRTSPYAFEDRGEQSFRNIAEPVRVYRLRDEIRRHPYQITHTQAAPNPAKRPHSLAVVRRRESISGPCGASSRRRSTSCGNISSSRGLHAPDAINFVRPRSSRCDRSHAEEALAGRHLPVLAAPSASSARRA